MALTSKAIVSTIGTVQADVDAYLATLATSAIIAGLSIDSFIVGKRLSTKVGINILANTGGAVVATPWQSLYLQATTPAALDTAMATFLAAHPTAFIGAPRLRYLSPENGEFDQFVGMLLWNATAGASANYLLR